MPPRGSGVTDAQMLEAQGAAIAFFAGALAERKLVVCLPRLPGGDRAAGGPLGEQVEQELLDGALAAVNAVREELGRSEWKQQTFWKNVMLPLEQRCEHGDPAAFLAVAAAHGV